MITTTQARPNHSTTTAASMPSRFDTEALLSRASLLTYALQGLINDVEGGSEIEAEALHPIFVMALELAGHARQLHQVSR